MAAVERSGRLQLHHERGLKKCHTLPNMAFSLLHRSTLWAILYTHGGTSSMLELHTDGPNGDQLSFLFMFTSSVY